MKARKLRRTPADNNAAADIEPLAHNRLLGERRLSPADAVDRQRVIVNLAESPLAWLARRGLLTSPQFQAGERLRHDFMLAGHAPSVTMRWDAVPGRGSGGDPTSTQLDARRRFDTAVAAAGPGLSDVLWRVVCLGDGLETAEKALGWPARAGKLVLTLALDRLAAHYRLG